MTAIMRDERTGPMAAEANAARAKRLGERMDELGIKKSPLAMASKKSRNTIDKALAGDPKVRDVTYDDLFRVLDEIEEDRDAAVGHYTPDGVPELVTIEMTGVFGIESVTFSGPPEDADTITQKAVEFVRQLREGTQ